MAEPVKIRVDLSTGTIDVEADASNIEAVFDRLDSFVPRLSEAYGRFCREDKSSPGSGGSVVAPASSVGAGESGATPLTEPKVEVRKVSKGAKGKEIYSAVDLGLSEEQRAALRDFYAKKQPHSQNEKVAVLMDWLKREGGKATTTWNEIFTAFRTVGDKSPAKISSVLGNMVGLSWVRNAGGGQYDLIHVGEDFVKFNLPKAAKKAS